MLNCIDKSCIYILKKLCVRWSRKKSSLFLETKNAFRLVKITHMNLLLLNLCRQVRPQKGDKVG